MAYTTRTKVEYLYGQDLSAYDSAITQYIAWVKAWIDKYCGRTFESTEEDRYYDGNGKDRILVDSFTGTPSLVELLNSDGSVRFTLTEGAGSDYVAYPLNSTEKNELVIMPGSPIRAFSRAYFEDLLDDDDLNDPGFTQRRVLHVKANFGAAAAIPADVELAATKLVAQLVSGRLSGSEADVKSEKLGDYSITFGQIDELADALGVFNTLDQWREPTI